MFLFQILLFTSFVALSARGFNFTAGAPSECDDLTVTWSGEYDFHESRTVWVDAKRRRATTLSSSYYSGQCVGSIS